MNLSEYPTWTANIVAAIMSFLTMGVALGWWGLGEGQLAAIQTFIENITPMLIILYFAVASWWAKRQTIAKATIKRVGIQAAMKQAKM